MDVRPTIRTLSKTLFGGAQYRLEVSASLHSGVPFTAVDLEMLLGDPPGKGSIHTELKRLREAGLVLEQKSARSDRAKPLVPKECSFWDACRELVGLAEERAAKKVAARKALLDAAIDDPQLARLVDDEELWKVS